MSLKIVEIFIRSRIKKQFLMSQLKDSNGPKVEKENFKKINILFWRL